MIADRDDDRVSGPVVVVEPLEKAADLRVHVGDLAEVGTVPIALGPGFRRLVGRVRVVVVDPGEEALTGGLVEPRQRGVGHLARRSFDLVERHVHGVAEVEVVEVVVEALADPPLRVEDERRHESPGAQPLVAQDLRQDHVLVVQVEAAVVPNPMRRRILASEDRRVRRQRQRRHRLRLLEQHTLSRQPIQMRRLDVREPIGPDPVRPRRVQRDQQHAQIIGSHPVRKQSQDMPRRRRDLPAGQQPDRHTDHHHTRNGQSHRKPDPSSRALHIIPANWSAAHDEEKSLTAGRSRLLMSGTCVRHTLWTPRDKAGPCSRATPSSLPRSGGEGPSGLEASDAQQPLVVRQQPERSRPKRAQTPHPPRKRERPPGPSPPDRGRRVPPAPAPRRRAAA